MLQRTLPIALLSCLGAIVAVPTGRQQQTTSPSQQQTPKQPAAVLRTTTRVVEMSVVVHNKKGNCITGLTRDDFIVKDEGKQQDIRFFLEEKQQPPSPEAGPTTLGFFTNLNELQSGASSNYNVILLDGLNSKFEDRAFARQQIIKFLKQLQPNDRVALYALGTQLRVLYDFTDNAAELLKALDTYKGVPLSDMDDPYQPANSRFRGLNMLFEESRQAILEAKTGNKILFTVQAMEAIADHLAGLPGRKNLVWVSDGFPLYMGFHKFGGRQFPSSAGQAYFLEVERAARALEKANMAVYPVDAHGMLAPPTAIRGGPGEVYALEPSAVNMFTGADNDSTMDFLAKRTGGIAFHNENDIRRAIRRAIDDSSDSYLLGYSPEGIAWDGKFRKVRVEVKRPGTEVRTREGYFALPDQSKDFTERRIELLKTAFNPLDSTGIPLRAKAEVVEDAPTRKIKLLMQLDPHALRLEEEQEQWNGAIDFFYVLRNPDGSVAKVTDRTLSLRLLPETHDKVMREGLYVSTEVELEAGATELRIIARDVNSESIGSLTIPLSALPAPNQKN
ncbi:MAG: VWA domain-containing protein [Candidatus Acidiferrales bacterium]